MSKLASEFVSKKSYDGQVHVGTSLLFDKVFEEQRKIRDPFLHKTVLIDRIHTQHDICLIESGLTRCLVKVGVGGGLTSPIHHISLKLQEYILTSFNIIQVEVFSTKRMSEFITKPVGGEEPSGSTKIELKVDPNETEQISNKLTSHIDDVDHSSVEHRDKIEELRKLLTPEMNEHFSNRDCERFLIARSFNQTKAFDMLKKRYDWYNTPVSTFKIDNPSLRPRDMGTTPTDTKDEIFSREFPCSNLGEDREGHPIYWEKSGYVASNWANVRKNFTPDELTARHIRQQEIVRERCRLSSIRRGRLIEKGIVIMDLKGIPIFVEWACFKSLKEVITIDEAYYPETLKNLFVINAPVYFKALWAIVKPWLDPLTLEKIQICGENYYPVLSKYIDDDVLPAEYGGKNNNFSWVSPTNLILE